MSKHIDNKGQIKNAQSFIDDWFRAAIKYYFDIEKFDSLVVLDRAGKMAYLDKGADPVSILKIKATPSFTGSSGTQGGTFQIGI